MCGELNFPLYEIAKILDIHISRPILFIKSITCGQCQKMKYVKFENVLFSFSSHSYPQQFFPWNQMSQSFLAMEVTLKLMLTYEVKKSHLFHAGKMFLLQICRWNLLWKMSHHIFGKKYGKYGTAIEIFNDKCIFLKQLWKSSMKR